MTFLAWYSTTILPAAAIIDAFTVLGVGVWFWRHHGRRFIQFLKDAKGTAAIEFAIIAPCLLLICGLVYDGGLGLQAKQSVMFGTQQAAIAAANGSPAAQWQAVFAASLVPQASSPTCQCTQSGTQWTCTGSASYSSAFSGLAGIPPLWPISHSATAVPPSAPTPPSS